jgi:transmembrane sensor
MAPSKESEAIEQEAAQWVVRRDREPWTEADQARLDAWIAQDLAHRIAYVRLEATWTLCAQLRAMTDNLEPGVVPVSVEGLLFS